MIAAFRLPPRVRRLILAVALVVAVIALVRLPWTAMFAQVRSADFRLLGVAMVCQLLALMVKGWSWHLLLRPVAPHRWAVAQEANLIGAAVNTVSVTVAGEAARVHTVHRREGVPVGLAVASVAWQRGIEAVGLAVFLLVIPIFLPLPAPLRTLQIGAGLALLAVLTLALFRGWSNILHRIPMLGRAVERLAEIPSAGGLGGPILLVIANWMLLWVSLHATLHATDVTVPIAASFAALMAGDLAGIPRLTPANVGVLQAAIVVALLPFGVPPGEAVAAGITLQAIQVLPVLTLAALLGLRRPLRAAQDYSKEVAQRPRDERRAS